MTATNVCKAQLCVFGETLALQALNYGCYMQAFEFIALSKAEGVWNVKHPLLDKVRRCSAEPEEAAKFFAIVLFPGAERASAFVAQRMPYLKKLRRELTDYNNCNPFKTCESTLYMAVPHTHGPFSFS